MTRRVAALRMVSCIGVLIASGCGAADGDEVAATTPPVGTDALVSLEIPLAPPPTLDIGLALPPELEGVTVETVPPEPAPSTTSPVTVGPTSTTSATAPPTTAPPAAACTIKATVENESLGFAKDSPEISAEGEVLLDDFVAGVLAANSELDVDLIEIHGHASADGSADHNQWLSDQRAAAVDGVIRRIPALAGVAIVAVGHGETAPIADNGTEAGRRANRRVEIFVHFAGCG